MDAKVELIVGMAKEAFLTLKETPLGRVDLLQKHEGHEIGMKFHRESVKGVPALAIVHGPNQHHWTVGFIARNFHNGKLAAIPTEARDFRNTTHEMYPWVMALREAVRLLNEEGI